MLEIRDLVASIGGTTILRGVSLTVPDGEVHVLLGPNGSGKTSLLRAVMGFPDVRVEGGEIRFDGEDLAGLGLDERARRGIGISLQRPPPSGG